MFRANTRYLQPALISSVNDLPEKRRQRLEASWAGVFRREFFGRLQEEAFAVLYRDAPSRPNVPVNVLVGLETLKGGYGWSDEELYDHFLYDLQVRYALGYESLGEGDFELRTLYNFRRRLSEYHLSHGTNLLALAFVDITDQQLTHLAVRSGQQRMDSTQVASNIMRMSRLQLAVEAIQRLVRLLRDDERKHYAALVGAYVGERAGHYVYRVKGPVAQAEQLQAAGAVLYQLLQALAPAYAEQPAYQVVARLFGEQFEVVAASVTAKANAALTASSLQSLDDLEATYRAKNQVGYRGYVANLSETCDPANDLQLITDVRVASNTTQDSALLIAALPELKRRTGLATLYTDGAFGSPEADVVLQDQRVTLLQTGLMGQVASPEQLHLADFAITQDASGQPLLVTCPQGQSTAVQAGRRPGRFCARFDPRSCQDCPLQQAHRCPPQRRRDRHSQGLSFGWADVAQSQRHRRSHALRQQVGNPRAAVEAAVRSLKHPFRAGKLPVRGLFRVTCMLLSAAAMTNVRRIQRYLAARALPPPHAAAAGSIARARKPPDKSKPCGATAATADPRRPSFQHLAGRLVAHCQPIAAG